MVQEQCFEFTIKLYQDGAEVGDTIFHDGEEKSIMQPNNYTENGGHYQVDRIEAPGRAGGRNYYYVARDLSMTRQVYEKYSIFLQNGGGDLDTADPIY